MKIILGNKYVKFLLWRGKREYSFFIWFPRAASPPHDHDVSERTYVLWAGGLGIFETRRVGEAYTTTFHKRRAIIKVPAGTEHIVGTFNFAMTFNACDGPLTMKILDDFNPSNAR